MSREIMQQALNALEGIHVGNMTPMAEENWNKALTALRQALAQSEQELVTHAVIAGVLFDFMGWLTSRPKRLVLSASDNASPAVKVIEEFAKMRGLSLEKILLGICRTR